MQTFLPFPSFRDSAECLDYRRLGKQRVETLQLLKAAWQGPLVLYDKIEKEYVYNDVFDVNDKNNHESFDIRKTPWYNHPACQMWLGYELRLCRYGEEICEEWIRRGFKDTCLSKLKKYSTYYGLQADNDPPFIGDEKFHTSYKSNLIRKDAGFYGPKFPDVPENLEYIWPE